jgi:hypothetical protein
MRKIHDVLRLSAAGMSKRKIAASLGVSATAAGECIRRARRAGLGWPLPEGLTDEALEDRLYPPPAGGGQGWSPAAGLGGGPPRAAPARGDAPAAVGGASGRPPRGLWL